MTLISTFHLYMSENTAKKQKKNLLQQNIEITFPVANKIKKV